MVLHHLTSLDRRFMLRSDLLDALRSIPDEETQDGTPIHDTLLVKTLGKGPRRRPATATGSTCR